MEVGKPIIIERVFDAPRERVWEVWTSPEEVKKWWGPGGFTAPHINIDFKVGGKFLYAMHGPVGTEFDRDMWNGGEYKEIVPMEKIVATNYFSDEHGNKVSPSTQGLSADIPEVMEVITTFEDAGDGKTKLSIIYPAPQDEAQLKAAKASRMDEGWASSLDKFAAAL